MNVDQDSTHELPDENTGQVHTQYVYVLEEEWAVVGVFSLLVKRCSTPRDYDTELKSTEGSLKYQTYELPDGNTITSD